MINKKRKKVIRMSSTNSQFVLAYELHFFSLPRASQNLGTTLVVSIRVAYVRNPKHPLLQHCARSVEFH